MDKQLADKQLAEWLWKRLDKCLPCDDWQRDQLTELARDLSNSNTSTKNHGQESRRQTPQATEAKPQE